MKWRALLLLILLLPGLPGYSQYNSIDSARGKNLKQGILIAGSAYTVTMIGLYELWYKGNGYQSFRFFNDNSEWKQMDKVGHFYSTFYLSMIADEGLRYYGVAATRSHWIGSVIAFGTMLPIEIFDGFSPAYGASSGDLLANASGSLLYFSQQLAWGETRLVPKWSFHRTRYAPLRPNTLGSSLLTEALKDYNGQTYWLSVDMDKFCRFPAWLNLAVGYGAEGMVYATTAQNSPLPYRQYYLALDFDLTGIRTRSRGLKMLFKALSAVKLPAPTMEFQSGKVRFHAFYF